MRSTRLIAILCCSVLASVPVLAQGPEYSKQEASVQALGSFVKSTWDKGIEQKASNSGGVLASYRYFFTNKNGVEVNYAFSTNTQSYNSIGVDSHSNEVSAAYVFRMPLKHFTPFVLAGAGGLYFLRRTSFRRAPRPAPRSSTGEVRTSTSVRACSSAPNTAG